MGYRKGKWALVKNNLEELQDEIKGNDTNDKVPKIEKKYENHVLKIRSDCGTMVNCISDDSQVLDYYIEEVDVFNTKLEAKVHQIIDINEDK